MVNYELAQVNPESGVPLSCLPAYFEAYDAYAQRVDHEVDNEDCEVDEVDNVVDNEDIEVDEVDHEVGGRS